jgi:hypothetical protein
MIDKYLQRSLSVVSLLALLHPRGQTIGFGIAIAVGLGAGWLATTRLQLPLWSAVVIVVAALLYPVARKWQRDRQLLGTPAMVLSILLATQTFHTIEHVAQWVQYHLLGWPMKASSGLISPLNAEIVHFSWNVAVLLVVIYLLGSGLRSVWMWLLLAWATAHTAEHTYLFVNYLIELQQLRTQGLPPGAAQGLPGVLGQNGWLSANQNSAPIAFICRIAPGFVSAPRLDVHFWWNVGEIALLLPAAHTAMRRMTSMRHEA